MSEDGNTETYTLEIWRTSIDATLKSILLNNGAISFDFNPAVFSYTVTVPNAVSVITLSAETNYSPATVTDGTGNCSLPVGDTVLAVGVTAEDTEYTETYTVTVHRKSTDASLKFLTLNNGDIPLEFDPASLSYTVTVPSSVSSLAINAEPNHEFAVITAGAVDTDITQYTANVPDSISSVTVNMETNYPLATCLISKGDDFGEPGIKQLNAGENVFGISIFSENKKYYKTYRVSITREDFKEEDPTSIPFIKEEYPVIHIQQGQMEIETPFTETVRVYSLDGQLLYTAKKLSGKITFDILYLKRNVLIIKGSSGWVKTTTGN